MNSRTPFGLEAGLTRRETLRRAVAGGVVLSASGLLVACGDGGSSTTPAAATGTPAAGAKGGTLRVGVSGGSTSDTLDAHNPLTDADIARVYQLYDPLAINNTDAQLEMALAESIEADGSADVWTVRLKPDLTFHDGSPVTSDAVVASIDRIRDPKSPGRGAAALADIKRMRKLDDRTVRFQLKRANSEFPRALGEYYNGIVPVDYDPAKPIGTGPFSYESFAPGKRSEFVAFADYFRGAPALERVEIIDLSEDTARVNALLGGQVDAINNLPFSQVPAIEADSKLATLIAETGNWVPFTMRVDAAPFDDPRVRQAMRLIIDRQQVADQAFGGQAQVANDLFARYDPCYNSDIAQRQQDIEQARSLLSSAGRGDLTVELTTSNVTVGAVESAQVLAEQAKQAGVTIKVRKVDSGVFYGDDYLKWPFAQNYWFTRYYLGQVAQSMLPTSGNNETHFDDGRYNRLFEEALAELDDDRRCDLIHEMQQIEHETGGYIIPTFNNQIDAHSSKVTGLVPAKTGGPLGNYGFRDVSLAA